MTGIHDALYLAQYLGSRIAVQDADNPLKFGIYKLVSIHCEKYVTVRSKDGTEERVSWERLENPYILLTDNKLEVEIR